MAAHFIRAKRTGVFWWIRRIVAWFVVLGVTSALALAVAAPRIGGATPYAVLTSSMEPDLPPGTLVVARPADPEDIGIGTVITYQLESGEQTVVTHRVVAVAQNAKGERVFTTQGDANNVADQKVVRPVQIRGALWYSVPYLGYANRYLTADQRSQLTLVVAGLLVAYAIWAVVSGLRDRRRRPAPARHLATATASASTRRARRQRRPRRQVGRRLRPLLPLLCLLVIAGLGAANTFAYWSDSGTVTTGQLSAGVLDLKLDSSDSITLSSLRLSNMVPGESVAQWFDVQNPSNASGAPFNYTATALTSGALASNLRFEVKTGSTSVSNTTPGGVRTGTCAGGSVTFASGSWASSTTVIPSQQLAVGASQKVCVVAKLDSGTASGAQGTSGSAVMTFTAMQLGAP